MKHPLIIDGFLSIKELALKVYHSAEQSFFCTQLASSLIAQADSDLLKGYNKLSLLGYLAGASLYTASNLIKNKEVVNNDVRTTALKSSFMRYDSINELINELLKLEFNEELLNASYYLSEMWRISKPRMVGLE